MPGQMMGRSDGVVGVEAPFHYVELWDRADTIEQAGSNSHSVNLPACLPGDILLLQGGVDNIETITLPTESPDEDGWIIHVHEVAGASTYICATKIAEESDSRGTVTATITSVEQGLWQVFCLAGCTGRDGIEGKETANGQVGVGNTTPWVFDSLAVSIIEHWKFLASLWQEDNRGPTNPEFYTRIFHHSVTGSGDAGASQTTWDRDRITAGSEQPEDVTISSDEDGSTQILALRPSAGELHEQTVAMTILNPTFTDAFPAAGEWVDRVGGSWQQNSGGFDAGFHAYAGNVAGQAYCYQDVPIPAALHAAVDAGLLRAEVSYYGESAGNDDEQLFLEWYDDESPENLLGVRYGNGQMGDHTEWTLRTHRHCAPVGARVLRIEMESNRDQSTSNDGYFDAFSGNWLVKAAGS